MAAAWVAWPRGAWRSLGSRLAPWGAGLPLVFGGVHGVCLARGWRLGELVSSWFVLSRPPWGSSIVTFSLLAIQISLKFSPRVTYRSFRIRIRFEQAWLVTSHNNAHPRQVVFLRNHKQQNPNTSNQVMSAEDLVRVVANTKGMPSYRPAEVKQELVYRSSGFWLG